MVLSHMPARAAAALIQGRLHIDAGRYEDARKQFTQALAVAQNKKSVIQSANWGFTQVELRTGHPQAALVHARRALDLSLSHQGGFPYAMSVGYSQLLLGRTLQALGDDAGAQQAFATAVLHLSNTVDEVHPLLVSARQLAKSRSSPCQTRTDPSARTANSC